MYNFKDTSSITNLDYDTINLRIEADYEIEVADDVFWVPVNQLGKTKHRTKDVKNMLFMSPQEKRLQIETLYEAIQLFQASNFRGVLDNEKYVIKNLCWNYHKPGFHAVRTNEGCCATNSNWLSFFLHDKYEQMGFIHYSQRDGNGHIMNFIFHNGWYYFIDMMMYRTDSLPYAGSETGTIEGYKDNELIAGNFYKSRAPISYVNLCLQKHKDAPVLFTISKEKEVYAMACDGVPNSFNVIHPSKMNLTVLYIEKDFESTLRFETPPLYKNNWDRLPTNKF